MELLKSFRDVASPLLTELLISDQEKNSDGSTTGRRKITCIVADGLSGFTIDVAEEIGIPVFSFRTASACNFWAYFCVPKLIDNGELPFKGKNLDVLVTSIPGMDGFLRRRDLPSFCRVGDVTDPDFQLFVDETLQSSRAQGLILNTLEELEGPILDQTRSRFPKIYTIGPLQTHLKSRLKEQICSSSLWEEDMSCITWLNAQPLRSVVYVSFGSLTMVTKDQLIEFWHGLINSGKRFLWVIRPNSVLEKNGESQILKELLQGTRDRGYIVDWAPQENVLAHQAIGGFLTHGGWNSILESVVAGVPMICWPYHGDQQINSRFVSEIWKLGLDMKDTCDRHVIEKMVRKLMDEMREEFKQSTDQMAKLAKNAVCEGGSSYCSLDSLIEDIRLMCVDH